MFSQWAPIVVPDHEPWKPAHWKAVDLAVARLTPAQTRPLCPSDKDECPSLIREAESEVAAHRAECCRICSDLSWQYQDILMNPDYITMRHAQQVWELRLEYMQARLQQATAMF